MKGGKSKIQIEGKPKFYKYYLTAFTFIEMLFGTMKKKKGRSFRTRVTETLASLLQRVYGPLYQNKAPS